MRVQLASHICQVTVAKLKGISLREVPVQEYGTCQKCKAPKSHHQKPKCKHTCMRSNCVISCRCLQPPRIQLITKCKWAELCKHRCAHRNTCGVDTFVDRHCAVISETQSNKSNAFTFSPLLMCAFTWIYANLCRVQYKTERTLIVAWAHILSLQKAN